MIKGLLLIALFAGYTLAGWECGCCPKWCDCLCEEAKRTGLEIAVVQDSSGSLTDDDWILSKTVLAAILCGIQCPGNKVAHISFSFGVELNWNLNSATGMSMHQTLIELLALPHMKGNATNTVGALQRVLSDVFNGLDNPDSPKIVLVMTDGASNVNTNLLPDVANMVHNTAKTFAIGVSDQINMQELSDIASGDGNNNVFKFENMSDLPTVVPDIIKAINDMFPCQPETQDCVCCCPPPEAFPKPHYYSGKYGCGCGDKSDGAYDGYYKYVGYV